MEESKTLIAELSEHLENQNLKETILRIMQELKDTEMAHKTKMEAIEDSITQVRRKNKQIESEIERMQLLQTKNAAAFNKKNSDRIRMSRKIIEFEQENEELEAGLLELTEKIVKIEDEIRLLGCPTVEELYYEIVRGFGVDFVEKEGKIYSRIKNKNKNDLFVVECDPFNIQESCEKIWDCIEF